MSVSPRSGAGGSFPFLYIIRFQMYWSLGLPTPLVGRDETYVLADFFVQNSIPINFYLNLFLM